MNDDRWYGFYLAIALIAIASVIIYFAVLVIRYYLDWAKEYDKNNDKEQAK